MGRLNALKLVATLLPMLTGNEALEYLASVDTQADEVLGLLDQCESVLRELPDDSRELPDDLRELPDES